MCQQAELSDRVAATELAQLGGAGLVEDLEPPGAHDVQRVARVALPEQPLAGSQADRPRPGAEGLAQRGLELGEQGNQRQEVRDRLRPCRPVRGLGD